MLRVAQLVTAAVPDERIEDDLVHQLVQLAGIYRVTLPQLPADLRLARLTVIIGADPAAPGNYLLDVPAVKAESPWPDARWTELTVQLNDRPGQELRGRLERASDMAVSLDPSSPPSWLT